MWRSRRAACLAVVFACVGLKPTRATQIEVLWDHGTHTTPSADERALRDALARYSAGDVESAARRVVANPPAWVPAAVDAAMRRTDEEISYHRRPANRLGATRDERLERHLRADRLNVLLLSAALQLDASRAALLDTVGQHVLGAERTIDKLHALRADFEQNGALPWPVGLNEPWERVTQGTPGPSGAASWPSVHRVVCRWYAAAGSRLQGLVELQLAPALNTRALARCPGDPDLLLARGSLVETRLALSQVDASLASILYPSDIRQRWRDELSDAERSFEQAMEAAGTGTEAGVRLARVRLLRGQHVPARDLLDRVLAGEPRAEIRYLGLLFRAAAAEQSGDLQAAERDYEAATELAPGAQTPLLALARLADERHRSADARSWIERALTAPARTGDPWRRYIQGQAWQLEDRLAALRRLEPH